MPEDQMTARTVVAERDGPVVTLLIDDPARRNPLSLATMDALRTALEAAGSDPSVRAVVIGATSKWQSDGRNTKLIHGKAIDDSALPVGVRWGVGGAIAQKFAREGCFTVITTRAAANASPEPFSNIALSLAGDVAVPTLLWLAAAHPWVFFPVLALLVVAAITVIVVLFRFLRALLRRFSRRTVAVEVLDV